LDDVTNTLNEVAPFDWRNFLTTRLNSTDFHAPLGGIEWSGWNLTYQPKPNGFLKDYEQVRRGFPALFRNNSTVTRGTSLASKQISKQEIGARKVGERNHPGILRCNHVVRQS